MKVSQPISRLFVPVMLACALLAGCAVESDPADLAGEDEAALATDDVASALATDNPVEKGAMSPMPSALPGAGACGCGDSGFANVCTVAVNLCNPGFHPRCNPWRFNCGACSCVAN
jgi:hypothetical protein